MVKNREKQQLLSPAELADKLGVRPAWVYANAERLGGFRLGEGPRAPWRFQGSSVGDHIRLINRKRAIQLEEKVNTNDTLTPPRRVRKAAPEPEPQETTNG